jgi:hypothetical protein
MLRPINEIKSHGNEPDRNSPGMILQISWLRSAF